MAREEEEGAHRSTISGAPRAVDYGGVAGFLLDQPYAAEAIA